MIQRALRKSLDHPHLPKTPSINNILFFGRVIVTKQRRRAYDRLRRNVCGLQLTVAKILTTDTHELHISAPQWVSAA